ncbi:twinkle mtDNA helicase-like [Ruditapes philippinarum]|uniref:twinkle mtDNA helicase-like n=1 Tax=Ruditapes philippinarum TaxID=129788 RepID=UPI00295AF345|nr:twinkle mtDNA helicase-like [Ruditapes philippinarum]
MRENTMYQFLQLQYLTQQVRYLRFLQSHLNSLSKKWTVGNSVSQRYTTTSRTYCCLCKNRNYSLIKRQGYGLRKEGERFLHDGINGNNGKDGNNQIENEAYSTNKEKSDKPECINDDRTNLAPTEITMTGTCSSQTEERNILDDTVEASLNDNVNEEVNLSEATGDAHKQVEKMDKKIADIDSAGDENGNNKSDIDIIKQFLTDNELGHVTGYTGYLTVCPKLGKLAMKRRRKEDSLYINATSGYFYCHHCGTSGSWSQLQDNVKYIKSRKKPLKQIECFKDIADVVRESNEDHTPVLKHFEGAHDFRSVTDEMFETIQSMFEWHGIEKRTFIEYGVKWRRKENEYWIMFPIYSPVNKVITSVKVFNGKVTEEGDIKINTVQKYPKGKMSYLFGWQNEGMIKRATKHTVVITATEADAMVVSQSTGILSLSLTNVSQLPQETLPFLEEFSKVILWLGTDSMAWDNTKVFSKKLGDKRCHVFKPTELKSMPHEVIQNGDSIHTILGKSKLMSHQSILTFANVRQEVYAEFADFNQVSGVKWKRYTKLNKLLKGHRRGELTILSGPTGSGKTTFTSEYALDLCMQGVNTLWGSFEISNVRLIKMMMQQFCEKSISKHLDEFDAIAEDFATLPMYFMAYYGEEQMRNVLEAMSHAVYIHDISHVIVDNLQFMIGMDYNERNRFFKQDQVVSSFRNFATEKNCHVTLIIHPRKLNETEELSTASIFGSAKVTQEADNILLIQDQRLTKSSRKKYVQIAKNRFDGDLGIMTLNFNKENLTFETKEKKKSKMLDEMEEEQEDEN